MGEGYHDVYNGAGSEKNAAEYLFIIACLYKRDGTIKQVSETFYSFIKHIHPVRVPLKALELKSTWGLGGMCLVLVFMLIGSGILMLFSYQPSPELAYNSIRNLESRFVFGPMIRSMHYFSANILAVMVFAHMMRVFFTLGYWGKIRRVNWLIGLGLFTLIMLSGFTGYLLPWDQTAYWAVTICINLLDYIPAGHIIKSVITSGNDVSEKTLHLFFTFHTTLIPALLIPLLATHFWKVRKAKGVVTSGLNTPGLDEKPVMVDTRTNLLLREAVTACVLTACIMTLCVLFKAPLGDLANAGLSPNPAKAPWYFAGFQELLFHFHPFFSVFIIPFILVIIMIIPPFIPWEVTETGIWFISKKAAKATGISALSSCVLTSVLILLDEYYVDFSNWFPDISGIISTGLIPFMLVLAMVFLHHRVIKIKFKLSGVEAFQATAAFYITAYIVLTLTCFWLRETDMKLIFKGI